MFRFQVYENEGRLPDDEAAAILALEKIGAVRIRPGVQRDMGTWWGSNQPPVIAFSHPSDDEAAVFRDFLRELAKYGPYSNRIRIETRRTR